MKIISFSILLLVLMYSSVCYSESYAQEHPMDGMQLKMQYCIDMQRYEGKPLEDVGCKVGRGNGKVGVKKAVIKQLVARMNKNKHSYEYQQLVSNSGLAIVFHDDSVGSKSNAKVWQDRYGRLYYEFDKEE
jgi:hypothetical protein